MDERRRVPEPSRPRDKRSEFRRDRDRILYSGHFARLAETTQVVSPERGYVFHNRLTHSLKVAQISRTIAEFFLQNHRTTIDALGGIDADAAEAAGLAHDLGHPPFGHIAEHELNELVRREGVRDGFEGNAQSFRIVCRLAVGDAWNANGDGIPGLNLTRSVMDGVIKYPWPVEGNAAKPNKWGHYREESDYFAWARDVSPPLQRSLIAEVMDWSDDVTYAIHDLLDFYRAGMIPLEQIRSIGGVPGPNVEREAFLEGLFKRRSEWVGRRAEYEAALDSILDLLPFDALRKYSATESDEQLLYRFSTELITKYVTAIAPGADGGPVVTIQLNARDEVDVLKEFVWAYVILNPDLALAQAGQPKAIRSVFEEFLTAARQQRLHFFPVAFRALIAGCTSTEGLVRIVADYVAGMTERELVETYRRLQAMINH